MCKCRPNYTGDPYTNCNFDPCSSSPCGQVSWTNHNTPFGHVTSYSLLIGAGRLLREQRPCRRLQVSAPGTVIMIMMMMMMMMTPQHIGDPYVSCRLDPCQGDACGPNAECQRSGDRAVCSCFRGYIGSPYR